MTYVIVSKCECGFWSNQYGWVHDKASASIFSNADEFPLPLRTRNEGSFLHVDLAPEFYLDEPLLPGDEVIWDDPRHPLKPLAMHVETVKTPDGCARTSEDVVVLRDAAGRTLETSARSVTCRSSVAMVA